MVRRHDPALDLLRELLRSPFPLAERLRKERALTPEELFYIAFNFAEGGGEEKGVARELLEHLAGQARAAPRSARRRRTSCACCPPAPDRHDADWGNQMGTAKRISRARAASALAILVLEWHCSAAVSASQAPRAPASAIVTAAARSP